MSFAPGPKDAPISLSVFGGLVSEMAAPDLPEGVSPDCPDCIFRPGEVASREALERVFAVPFPAGGSSGFVPSVVYAKSYAGPTGGILNLYLDSNNILWVEDLVNSPGTYNQLAVLLGLWAKSITAFGREYIATSDGLHGSDIPLQYDGTNLDRVTQDGPGAPPAVQSIALPSVGLGTNSIAPLTISTCVPIDFISFWVFCTTSVATLFPGLQIVISGSSVSAFNATWTISAVNAASNAVLVNAFISTGATGAGGTLTPASGISLTRQNNVVTAYTATAHNLKVGYQALIAGVPTSVVGTSISALVIDNENNPGVATVTTSTAHGLIPGSFVSISGVTEVAVGGGLTSIGWAGGIVTVATTTAHGLAPGAVIAISSTTAFNTGAVVVLQVQSTTVFTYAWVPLSAPAGETSGTISLLWPIPDSPTPTYFEVLSAPTATTFQVSVNYSDGTWSSGSVSFAWDGTFYVSAVLSATSFQYQQYGPNAGYAVNSGETITPFGQAAPGIHQCQVLFLTRQGAITRPSPPVQVIASGGQYLSVSNIPIGPSNVIARILAFTGAAGATYFYIPSTPQVNGQIVGTATQINDNVTTSIQLDFSDPTLFAATGISIPGNNLANQIVLDSALGFGFYGGRLIAWGMRNRIQNFLNLSFDGGQFYTGGVTPSNFPCGWLIGTGANGGGALVTTGRFGWGWQPSGAGSIYQSAYEDAYGAPILTPNTPYLLRAWINGGATTLTATISSASTGFSASATLTGVSTGTFQQANFSQTMPNPIPTDMRLTLTWTGTPIIDEISIIYQDNPYLDDIMYMSYFQNPEGIDGVTGKIGSLQDAHKVMDLADIRQTLYFLTQEPGGRLHETSDNGVTEPAGWTVNQVAANCGLLSAFGLTKSQADDSSAAGGEEWFAWASSSGARIFGGSEPWKISQEIQPDWQNIDPNHNSTAWALNDPVARRMYFGLPLTIPSQGAPVGSRGTATKIYMVDYRGLNTASDIGNTGPIRIGFTGRLVATDHARKWSPWQRPVNGAALMYRQAGELQPVFFAGNAWTPGLQQSTGEVYILNPAQLTDDDYGQINPYYTTYFMPTHDAEQAMQLGGGRKLLVYLQAFIAGVGMVTITPICDALTNPWSVTGSRVLNANPKVDLEWPGGNAQAQRIALKFASSPATGTDNSFNLQKVIAILRKVVHLPVRGAL